MLARSTDDLVFVPNVGFRLARGAMDAANVVVERDGRTLTAGLTSDRDGAELRISVAGLNETLDFRQSRPVDAPVRVADDRGRVVHEQPARYHVNSHFYRLMEGPTMFQRVVSLERIEPDARRSTSSWRGRLAFGTRPSRSHRRMRRDPAVRPPRRKKCGRALGSGA